MSFNKYLFIMTKRLSNRYLKLYFKRNNNIYFEEIVSYKSIGIKGEGIFPFMFPYYEIYPTLTFVFYKSAC